jgi:Flp pilus assembly protein TadB
MTFDGNPPPPPRSGRPVDPDAPPPDSMHPEVREQYALEQRMLEARLEAMRSNRDRRTGQVSRVMNLFFVFAIAGGVAFLLDAKGYSPKVSILSSIVTLVVIAGWWAYRKPY